MSAVEFLDTNVLIYAFDLSEERKQRIANNLVRRVIEGKMVISSQVLVEFSSTMLYKKKLAAPAAEVFQALDRLAPIRVIPPDWGTVRRAVEAHEEYGIHFYDGMIIAAAERAGCSRLWTEDLNAGQTYFGVTVENPFG